MWAPLKKDLISRYFNTLEFLRITAAPSPQAGLGAAVDAGD
jgi:hypothetical protein